MIACPCCVAHEAKLDCPKCGKPTVISLLAISADAKTGELTAGCPACQFVGPLPDEYNFLYFEHTNEDLPIR
jgi:hypothetical protein